MRPRTVRALRLALLGGGIALSLVVWMSLRRPERPPEPEPVVNPRQGATQNDVVFRTFRGGTQGISLEAKRQIGQNGDEVQLETLTMHFEFTARGQRQPGTITADAGTYTPAPLQAVFEHNVHLVTGDGFELWTDRLVYRAATQAARSAGPVRFRRKDLSGESVGMAYDARSGVLELQKDVVLRVQDPDEPEMTIRAAHARVERADHVVYFEDGTQVDREGDSISSEWLRLYMSADDAIERARFGGKVVWQGHGALDTPGGAAVPVSGKWWRLESTRLDLRFAPSREIDEAVASPDGRLTLGPPPGSREIRHLVSDTLSFQFDEGGRMRGLIGLGGSEGVSFETEPGDDAPPRTVTARRFTAAFDPETGQVARVDMFKDVRYVEGGRRGRAGTARWDRQAERLTLRQQPEIEDAGQGSQLFAGVIEIDSGSGNVHAVDGVRHVLHGRVGPLGSGDDQPTVVNCRTFDYKGSDESVRYEGSVVLRSGDDELRARTLQVVPEAGGTQQLTAIGDVLTRLRTEVAGATGDEAMEARAGRMDYAGSRGELRYTGGVTIHKADLETTSPTATLLLEGQPRRLRELDVGEPVEVRSGDRVAKGQRGRYTPDDGTMVIEGENASLSDPTQTVRGRRLTFKLTGDEDVTIDGEDVRTEMVIKEQSP